MNVKIDIPGFEEIRRNIKESTKAIFNKPVPLGKTVLVTAIVIGVTEAIIIRNFKVSIILSKN